MYASGTMMTGRYMHVLGHRTQDHLVRAYEENYFRLLKEDGYHVKWLGKNDALSGMASLSIPVMCLPYSGPLHPKIIQCVYIYLRVSITLCAVSQH